MSSERITWQSIAAKRNLDDRLKTIEEIARLNQLSSELELEIIKEKEQKQRTLKEQELTTLELIELKRQIKIANQRTETEKQRSEVERHILEARLMQERQLREAARLDTMIPKKFVSEPSSGKEVKIIAGRLFEISDKAVVPVISSASPRSVGLAGAREADQDIHDSKVKDDEVKTEPSIQNVLSELPEISQSMGPLIEGFASVLQSLGGAEEVPPPVKAVLPQTVIETLRLASSERLPEEQAEDVRPSTESSRESVSREITLKPENPSAHPPVVAVQESSTAVQPPIPVTVQVPNQAALVPNQTLPQPTATSSWSFGGLFSSAPPPPTQLVPSEEPWALTCVDAFANSLKEPDSPLLLPTLQSQPILKPRNRDPYQARDVKINEIDLEWRKKGKKKQISPVVAVKAVPEQKAPPASDAVTPAPPGTPMPVGVDREPAQVAIPKKDGGCIIN